jgi:hypothetical protein
MKFITIKVLSSDSQSQKPSLLTKTWIKTTKKQSSIKFIKKLYKIKIIFFTIVILLIYKFYKYCSIKAESENEENQNNSFMNSENDFLRYFQSLKNISYDNTSLLEEYRDNILKLFSKKLSKNITSIDNLYMDYYLKFGNHLAHFNKAIFYCEIIKCKKIFINPDNNIYIKNTIYDQQFNLSIEIAKKKEAYNNPLSTYYYPYYDFLFIRPENSFTIFKSEILRNLPKVQTNQNDLYIHIRGGDIFIDPKIGDSYAQPPYCFYDAAINNNRYYNIYLFSIDESNPVLNKLIKRHEEIIYNKLHLSYVIAYLSNAYNIVGSISSFITEIIKLNDNLLNFYEYDIYHIREKIFHIHSSLYGIKKNYVTYLMKPSKNYLKHMFIWKYTRKQRYIMLRDKCSKKFEKINPN